MLDCKKHIKCNKILGKIVGTDLHGNYIIAAKNHNYILYDEVLPNQKGKKVLLYELPDGTLLSRLTPSLGVETHNSFFKVDYEKTLEDTMTEKILRYSIEVGIQVGALIGFLKLILFFILVVSGQIGFVTGFWFLFISTPLSVFLTVVIVSMVYDFILQKRYSSLAPQEYFEKTGELKEEELHEICEYMLRKLH